MWTKHGTASSSVCVNVALWKTCMEFQQTVSGCYHSSFQGLMYCELDLGSRVAEKRRVQDSTCDKRGKCKDKDYAFQEFIPYRYEKWSPLKASLLESISRTMSYIPACELHMEELRYLIALNASQKRSWIHLTRSVNREADEHTERLLYYKSS